ncbi:hypothetical protein BDY24DRAFT_401164 [Mrakia frigida]|uniref:GNAT family N-acetyltransferase n=1 Tax=Mrakia frigida TaxID=29902 RepID=UPI003FCC2524
MAITYLNSYKPSISTYAEDIHLHTAPELYDFNFCLTSQPIRVLEGEGRFVRLEPFVPSVHSKQLFEEAHKNPELFQWMPTDMWTSLSDQLKWTEHWIRGNQANICYAIFDTKPGPNEGRLAGMISLINSSQADLITELGWVLVLPHSQRSHVLTHTVSLLLDIAFALPSEGGYGLRRVEWRANALNLPSVNAAIRLGMRNETPNTIKGHRLLLPGKLGSLPGRAGDVGWKDGGAADEAKPNATGNWSRSTNLLAITYDDWLAGGKERLDGMLVRN